ncbi:MAG TPA: hypothetical protein VFB58_11165 [Chloroflexota bacterium]|nr:hypothetical protein [Chloroflexota bacterium]
MPRNEDTPTLTTWPRASAPAALKWWNRLTLALLAVFLVAGATTRSKRPAGVVLVLGGLVQVVFGLALVLNYREFTDRVAHYYAHRPLMLGGHILNRSVKLTRIEGLAMVSAGLVLSSLGVLLLVT